MNSDSHHEIHETHEISGGEILDPLFVYFVVKNLVSGLCFEVSPRTPDRQTGNKRFTSARA
jgi:hypothetical protein